MNELADSSVVIVAVIATLAIAALVYAAVLRRQVLAADEGPQAMIDIAKAIQEGARAYMNRQLRTLVVFAVLVVGLLFLLPGDGGIKLGRSIAFLFGAGFSAAIGFLGMWLATRANLRVAFAGTQENGRARGAKIAFQTGGVVGMSVVGLGMLGATVVVLLYGADAPSVLEGFGFGAALLASFAAVFYRTDSFAALTGASVDLSGHHVGDCAGMAADLFESYAVTLVAALILGRATFGEQGIIFPLIVTGIGALVAALGVVTTRIRGEENGLRAIYRGFYTSALIGALLASFAAFFYLPDSFSALTGGSVDLSGHDGDPRLVSSLAVVIGVVLAGVILWVTGYFTGTTSKPTRHVARTSTTGPATVVLSGIGVGFESAVYTTGIIGAAILGVFLLAGGSVWLSLFLVALAGCGLLTTVGVIVAMDTFGPVSDNAQGIAEMSGEASEEAAQILTDLDAVGNTTKAITKGIAITTAVLAATALFGSYADAVTTALNKVGGVVDSDIVAAMMEYNIISPVTLVGVILGGATVFLFSGLAIDAVTRAAGAIVLEVRRQFRDKPGIMSGKERPDYARVVDICTQDSLRELVTPGLLAAFAPIAVGFGLGVGPLAGFLAGAIATGVLMAVFLSNAGGTWDNAKKIVEDGHYGGKNSPAHAAVVIGDTVGDPFKDTAGPAINPLIKVMNLVALLIAPAVVQIAVGDGASHTIRVAIGTFAGLIAVSSIIWSRLRAAKVDEEGRLEREVELVS